LNRANSGSNASLNAAAKPAARPLAAQQFANQFKTIFTGEDVARIVAEELARQKAGGDATGSAPKVDLAETENLIKQLLTKDQVIVGQDVQSASPGLISVSLRAFVRINFR